MLQVKVIKLENGEVVTNELTNIKVNKFTPEECLEVSNVFATLTFTGKDFMQFTNGNVTFLFIKQLFVK